MSAVKAVGGSHLQAVPRIRPTHPPSIIAGRSISASDDHLSTRSAPDAVSQGTCALQSVTADGYLSLRAIAEIFDDVQRVRIAVENRVRHATIDTELITERLTGLNDSEHKLGLLLRRTFRKQVDAEIVGWQARTIGVGEHMLARLLGIIGHPIHTTVHAWEGEGEKRSLVVVKQMDRRLSDLWSYCGHGDATRRRRRGMTAEEGSSCGNPKAKTLVHLMAESCLKHKARSPYGPVYDAARIRYAEREGWTPLHQHNAALRLVGKEILRDLWEVAR